ncbi:MAG: DUF924 family protein [Kiloniellaceae bacterium]
MSDSSTPDAEIPDADTAAIADILRFAFDDGPSSRWFRKDPDFDAAVCARLGVHYEAAAAGAHDRWMETAEGCLALCLVLDQAPRNLFRGDARAHGADAKARAVTRHALERGFDRQLPQARRMFLYLPLEHSESMADQNLCVRLMATLDEDPEWLDYARRHRDIIARFGRYPHRNAALGRDSTPEEVEFLSQPGSSF